jgi:lipid-binding SYLF domain-containing protein
MKTLTERSTVATVLIVGLATLGLATGVFAQRSPSEDMQDEIEQSEKAARAFDEIMAAPDKAIPQSVLDDADCVAVFPSVIKVAFGIGGRGGRGVASCRTPQGWSAPAYFNLGGGSVGFQIGAESTDVVMLFMTDRSIESLLASKLELGADASVAAGPVGRQAGASTDAKLNAQILTYSRSKGLFAGVALKGAVIQPAGDDMRDVYGPGVTAKDVLRDSKLTPPAVRAFPAALTSHAKTS